MTQSVTFVNNFLMVAIIMTWVKPLFRYCGYFLEDWYTGL